MTTEGRGDRLPNASSPDKGRRLLLMLALPWALGEKALPSAKVLGDGQVSARCSVALRRIPLSTDPARVFTPQNGLGIGSVGTA